MKILYFNPTDDSFMGQWQQFQIFDELKHYNVFFDVFNPWDYGDYIEANEALIKILRQNKGYDLFMSCASSQMLFESTMKELKSLPIPKLLICYDNLHAPFMHKKIAPLFDLVWLTSWETEPLFKKWGCNTIFQPYASNPFAFHSLYEKSVNKVCFVGTPYGTRSLIFNSLTQGCIDVDIFCQSSGTNKTVARIYQAPPKDFFDDLKNVTEHLSFSIGRKVLWSRIKRSIVSIPRLEESNHLFLKERLSNQVMNRAYSNYALSLNVITLRNTGLLRHPIQKIHLRTFEIPMCGGLELVEYNKELADYFSDNEMVFYHEKEEMIDKARFYTNPNNERVAREMKINARKRAANEHGWINRFCVVFDKLGLTYNKTPDIGIKI